MKTISLGGKTIKVQIWWLLSLDSTKKNKLKFRIELTTQLSFTCTCKLSLFCADHRGIVSALYSLKTYIIYIIHKVEIRAVRYASVCWCKKKCILYMIHVPEYYIFIFYVFERDTAGQERFESITKQFYRRAQVSIIILLGLFSVNFKL